MLRNERCEWSFCVCPYPPSLPIHDVVYPFRRHSLPLTGSAFRVLSVALHAMSMNRKMLMDFLMFSYL